jgi:hypothetical protein
MDVVLNKVTPPFSSTARKRRFYGEFPLAN